jgi:hypothetical protein
MNARWFYLLLALALGTVPGNAFACSVCFGDPASPVAQGVVMSVLALLGIVVTVLGGFAAFFIYIARRSSVTVPPPTQSAEPAKQL